MIKIKKKKIQPGLKKYSFEKFLALDDDVRQEYEFTGKLLKPDSWGVSDVVKWDYLTVKETQDEINKGITYDQLIDIIKRLTGLKADKILQKDWINVFKFYKFVELSVDKINELEQKLNYEPDANEENAGIEMYNQFGYFVTVDRLAGGDPLKYEMIGQMEYSVVFSKLLLNKTDMQFMRNYQKQLNK